MQKILRKRVFRDLKENLFRYLALGALIILGMYLVVSLTAAADTIISGTRQMAEENNLEDGQFRVFVPLSKQEKKELRAQGITLEEMFYLDFSMEDESTIRAYQNREEINLMAVDEGRLAENDGEVALEKRYASEHSYQLKDTITIAGNEYQIVGIGTTPDYEAPYKEFSDSAVDSGQFGVAFVTKDAYASLKASEKSDKSESYDYSYRLNGKMTNEELKEKIKEFDPSNLIMFLKAEDNPRIGAAADDQVINKLGGLIAGVIVMILFTYVISVFVIHGIEKESSIIGALYALGVKRKDLIWHYLQLPVTITLAAGLVGTGLAFSNIGVPVQMQDCYTYFSIPDLPVLYPGYLVVYSVVMPPVIALLVNYLVIRKALSKTVLSLLREEQKESKISNIDLGKMGFIRRFQVRQMLREIRTGFTVVFGMFISLLILMLGLNCLVMCNHIKEETEADTKFSYMYTYKYPEKEVVEGGEEAFAKTLKKEAYGYNLEVTLLGIKEENPYFDAKIEKGEGKVVISSAVAQKYKLDVGEDIVLKEEETERNYAFTVTDVMQYTTGFYVFMDIDSMRELFGEDEGYYNVVFSDEELDIAAGRLYAAASRKDLIHSSSIFVDKMMPMVIMMSSVAVLIFCVVMYLMLKVMVDRSAFGISLVKIFGFRTGEIRKLYLNGNFYIIVAGAAISIPLSKKAMDLMFPYMTSNVACGMNLTFDWQLYALIFGAVILMYLVINQVLVYRIRKIVPAEVLKNRE